MESLTVFKTEKIDEAIRNVEVPKFYSVFGTLCKITAPDSPRLVAPMVMELETASPVCDYCRYHEGPSSSFLLPKTLKCVCFYEEFSSSVSNLTCTINEANFGPIFTFYMAGKTWEAIVKPDGIHMKGWEGGQATSPSPTHQFICSGIRITNAVTKEHVYSFQLKH